MPTKNIVARLKVRVNPAGSVYDVQEAYEFAKDQFSTLAKKNLRVPVISVRL